MNWKINIPETFYSDAEGMPFENCVICNKYLLNEGTSYVIEKALKTYEGYNFCSTIYEYAMCQDCHMKMQSRMSNESKLNLQHYFLEAVKQRNDEGIFIDVYNFNIKDWLSKCFIKGVSVTEMREYQIMAQFDGSKMIISTPPLLIGEEAINELSSLLSVKTTEEMNDFKDKYLGPPPSVEELISSKKLIVI